MTDTCPHCGLPQGGALEKHLRAAMLPPKTPTPVATAVLECDIVWLAPLELAKGLRYCDVTLAPKDPRVIRYLSNLEGEMELEVKYRLEDDVFDFLSATDRDTGWPLPITVQTEAWLILCMEVK